MLKPSGGRSFRHAHIVADSDEGFGLARMYELLGSDLEGEHRVFRAREEAWSWLTGDD